MSNKGFTLAEVLVTLAVIGVVAALTIPTLMHNTAEQQYRAGAKTAYSIISQAMTQAKADHYDTFMDVFSSSNDAKDTFKKYFNYIKECDNGTSDGNCWVNTNDDKDLDGAALTWIDVAGLVLNNGMFVRFWMGGPTCADASYYQDGICGMIEIDSNGFKGPNVAGKDILEVFVLKDKIIPAGVNGSLGTYGECSSSSSGLGCLSRYLDGSL